MLKIICTTAQNLCAKIFVPHYYMHEDHIFWEVMSRSLVESLSEFTNQLTYEFNIDSPLVSVKCASILL